MDFEIMRVDCMIVNVTVIELLQSFIQRHPEKKVYFLISVAQFDAGLSPRQISPVPADEETKEG